MEGGALVINWGLMAEYSGLDAAEIKQREHVRRLVEAQLQRQREAVAPRKADPAPSSPPSVERASLATPVDPVSVLSLALDAATDDTSRAALLSAAPKAVRDQLTALLRYQALMRPTVDPYDAFERALDAARDDAARRALFVGRDAAFLAEWAFRARATSEVWRKHYLAMVAGDES
jgi:hypothetical protein